MSFTGNEDQTVSFETGAALTANYRAKMEPGARLGGYISKYSLNALLEQEDCIGIRIYLGLNEDEEQEVVLVGVYANEDDIISSEAVCVDSWIPCPTHCSSPNILNGAE